MTNNAPFTVEEIMAATNGTLINGEGTWETAGVSTDTRSLKKGNIFVALHGENFDGNDFIGKAVASGACCVVGSSLDLLNAISVKPNKNREITSILVDDTTLAFQELARFHKRRFKPRVVGITGSNGKSSTKEMAASVTGIRFQTLKNEGNLNNHIGLPGTLFNLSEKDEVLVVEMGMRGEGEIRRLCEIASPDIGVITNIGPAHMERLGSMAAIRRAKGELINSLNENGIAVLNADDSEVISLGDSFKGRVISFGIEKDAEVKASRIKLEKGGYTFDINIAEESKSVNISCLGYYDIYNALAAAAVGVALGISIADIARGLGLYQPLPMRMEPVKIGKITVINDAYNANPCSMEMAIKTLADLNPSGNRVFVIGDMLELGEESEERHRDIGHSVAHEKIDFFYTFGPMSRFAAKTAVSDGMAPNHVFHSDDYNELVGAIDRELNDGDCVMLKGSRGMGMERVIDGLIRKRTNN